MTLSRGKMKKLHPMGKIYDRAKTYAYRKCGLSKEIDLMYFDMVVSAYLAGYKSALREDIRQYKENTDDKRRSN